MPSTEHMAAVPGRKTCAVSQRHDETLKHTRHQKKRRAHTILNSGPGKHHHHVCDDTLHQQQHRALTPHRRMTPPLFTALPSSAAASDLYVVPERIGGWAARLAQPPQGALFGLPHAAAGYLPAPRKLRHTPPAAAVQAVARHHNRELLLGQNDAEDRRHVLAEHRLANRHLG